MPQGRNGLSSIFQVTGSQGKTLEQKLGGSCGLACFLTQAQQAFFIETRTTGQGMALPTVGWNLLQRLCPTDKLTGHSEMDRFLN